MTDDRIKEIAHGHGIHPDFAFMECVRAFLAETSDKQEAVSNEIIQAIQAYGDARADSSPNSAVRFTDAIRLIRQARNKPAESGKQERSERLRKSLFEARDAMRVMSNWSKKADPAGYSWAVRMVDRANSVLNHEPDAAPLANQSNKQEAHEKALADSINRGVGVVKVLYVDPNEHPDDQAVDRFAQAMALLNNHIELNMSNYDSDDVSALNEWALRAYDFIKGASK